MVHWFMWLDENCHPPEVRAHFTYDWVQLPDGGRVQVPLRDAQLLVASHNMARAENSKHCFMPQLYGLLQHAGHRHGRWELTEEEQRAREQLTAAGTGQQKAVGMLLAAEPITNQTMGLYKKARDSNRATAEQKLALDRWFHCKAWGIDNMAAAGHPDAFEEFLKKHGTDVEAYKLCMCAAIFQRPELSNGMQAGRGDIGSDTAPEKPAAFLRELLHACGITNPFHPQSVECQVTPAVHARLRQCTAFRSTEEYLEKVSPLFGIKVQRGEPLDFAANRDDLTRHFILLFRRAGLAVQTVRHGNRDRSRSRAAADNSIPYLSFRKGSRKDPEHNEKMADLIKVKVAKRPLLYVEELATFMQHYELKHYQQLCGPVLASLRQRS
jgi:hypothetical protein